MKFDSKHNNEHQWIASCEKGFENTLEQELLSFNAEVTETRAGIVRFSGTVEVAMRCCLWSRVALKVFKPLMQMTISDADELYAKASTLEWADVLDVENSFSVDVASSQSCINNTHYAALRVKDAVVDYFQEKHGVRPSVETRRPDIKLFLYLNNNEATLNLDFSGDSLHRRAYREESVEAPIKEHLAAGILMQMGWLPTLFNNADAGESNTPALSFIDPFCGSGTFLIEAAMIATDTAPGLMRDYYGFFASKLFNEELWCSLKEQAVLRREQGRQNCKAKIIGYDADKNAIRIANRNLKKAQLDHLVHIERRELAHFSAPAKKGNLVAAIEQPSGFIATNPPYGDRLGEVKSVRYLYRCLAEKLKENFENWQVAVISDQVEHLDSMRFNNHQTRRVLHGGGNAVFRVFRVPQVASHLSFPRFNGISIQGEQTLSDKCSSDLANRLKKNFKRLQKSFGKEMPYCFRLYDADLPEYNVAIDFYGNCAHIQEYAPPSNIELEKARGRFNCSVVTVRELFGIKYENVFRKVRSRQKGKEQYTKKGKEEKLLEVYEDSSRFLVNLRDYLDTGLFIDHRIARKFIEDNAKGKHFLNLFSYTCTASVHAAMGGAKSTTSVDLSQNYLDWARCNFNLNGFSETQHDLIKADVMAWLEKSSHQYDFIFIDPPTFSNSKKMRDHFDVQAQHVALLRLAMKHLSEGGQILFSNNFKRFEFDAEALLDLDVEEITNTTRSPDFVRKGHLHRSWIIKRRVR